MRELEKSRELDMMSDVEKVDVILGNDNINPSECEFSNVTGNSENLSDTESNSQFRENNPQGNGFGHYVHEDIVPGQDRFKGTLEPFTSDFNMRVSQEMDSMMSMMHTQINTAIVVRVIQEIQNIVSSMSSSGNRDTESGLSPDSQEVREDTNGFESKMPKRHCRSAVDLRDNRDRSHYIYHIDHCMHFMFSINDEGRNDFISVNYSISICLLI